MLNDAQLTAVGKHIALALDTPDAAITDIRRFHGGASRETYAIDVAAGDIRHALILRCDPGDSLIDTPRARSCGTRERRRPTAAPGSR